jgi:peroxiredoxin
MPILPSTRAQLRHAAKLIVILAAAFALGSCARSAPETAPEVRYVSLLGQPFSTSDLRGKVVLVNFWATSCEVCVREMPMLTDTWRKFESRGYEMVAVAMSYDHPNLVADYVRRNQLPFRVALDLEGRAARQWGDIRATPTTFLVDRRGRIVKRYVGEPNATELRALIEKTLAEPA